MCIEIFGYEGHEQRKSFSTKIGNRIAENILNEHAPTLLKYDLCCLYSHGEHVLLLRL
jgi:lysyl-tRNA synthetase class I